MLFFLVILIKSNIIISHTEQCVHKLFNFFYLVPSNPGVKDNSSETKNRTKQRLLVSNSDREIALGYKKKYSAFAESFQAYEDDNKPWDIVSRYVIFMITICPFCLTIKLERHILKMQL